MGILLWVLFGGIVGWVASVIMGTNSQQGFLLNIVIGIVGAVLGGWLMTYFGEGGVSGFNLYSFGVAIVGAVILIGVLKMLRVT